ncbi:MAG TPA: nodulation protein NodZ [Thermodesulfobacteriota bacterium]|nr:nodulation protein NodZ [Thermodesulfobacteriota bacterium]
MISAANVWSYAKNTKRTLVIIWAPSRYLSDKYENAFSHFFSVPETIGGVPVIVEKRIDRLSAFIIAYSVILLPLPDPLILLYGILFKLGLNVRERLKNRRDKRQVFVDRTISGRRESSWKIFITNGGYFQCEDEMKVFFDAIRLNPEFRGEAEEFAEKHFKNKKVIGVHIRYYGKSLPHSDHTHLWLDETNALMSCFNKIKAVVAEMKESEYVIFLCTDSRLVYDFLTRSIGSIVTYEKDFGSDGSKELHQELPVETAAASIIEMFLLAKSDVLVRFPEWSWFSYYGSLYAGKIVT